MCGCGVCEAKNAELSTTFGVPICLSFALSLIVCGNDLRLYELLAVAVVVKYQCHSRRYSKIRAI
jgi:hypothetical protein